MLRDKDTIADSFNEHIRELIKIAGLIAKSDVEKCALEKLSTQLYSIRSISGKTYVLEYSAEKIKEYETPILEKNYDMIISMVEEEKNKVNTLISSLISIIQKRIKNLRKTELDIIHEHICGLLFDSSEYLLI